MPKIHRVLAFARIRGLPPIDHLEGFQPGGNSMYQRVMAAVSCERTSIATQIYSMPRIDNSTRLDSDVCA